jgi:hypothetical protein
VPDWEGFYKGLQVGLDWDRDAFQIAAFSPRRLAREYPESAITRPFPFNSFYQPNTPDKAPVIDPATYRLNISGRAERSDDWTLDQLYALPRVKHWHRLPFVMPRRSGSSAARLQRQKHGLGDGGHGLAPTVARRQ